MRGRFAARPDRAAHHDRDRSSRPPAGRCRSGGTTAAGRAQRDRRLHADRAGPVLHPSAWAPASSSASLATSPHRRTAPVGPDHRATKRRELGRSSTGRHADVGGSCPERAAPGRRPRAAVAGPGRASATTRSASPTSHRTPGRRPEDEPPRAGRARPPHGAGVRMRARPERAPPRRPGRDARRHPQPPGPRCRRRPMHPETGEERPEPAARAAARPGSSAGTRPGLRHRSRQRARAQPRRRRARHSDGQPTSSRIGLPSSAIGSIHQRPAKPRARPAARQARPGRRTEEEGPGVGAGPAAHQQSERAADRPSAGRWPGRTPALPRPSGAWLCSRRTASATRPSGLAEALRRCGETPPGGREEPQSPLAPGARQARAARRARRTRARDASATGRERRPGGGRPAQGGPGGRPADSSAASRSQTSSQLERRSPRPAEHGRRRHSRRDRRRHARCEHERPAPPGRAAAATGRPRGQQPAPSPLAARPVAARPAEAGAQPERGGQRRQSGRGERGRHAHAARPVGQRGSPGPGPRDRRPGTRPRCASRPVRRVARRGHRDLAQQPPAVQVAAEVDDRVDAGQRTGCAPPRGRARRPGPAPRSGRARRAAELAWRVPQPPSWPVLRAASSSTTSAPRTSPTTSRSGRIRSACRTSVRRVDLAGALDVRRAAPRAPTTCGWSGRSSLASSTSTSRSCRATRDEQRGQQRGLARAGAAADQEREPARDDAPQQPGAVARSSVPAATSSSRVKAARARAPAARAACPAAPAAPAPRGTGCRRGAGRRRAGVASSSRRPARGRQPLGQPPHRVLVGERARRRARGPAPRST